MTTATLDRPNTLSLFPRQMRFVQDTSRYPAAIGGIGSGKTFVGAAKVISRLSRKEFGLITAPTYKMLRDATQRTLFDMMKDLGIEYVHHKGDNQVTIPSTGHEIIFRSLDDPDNLRGPNVAYTWVDEAAYISAEAWRIVKGRTRVGDMQQAWITGTPKGRNWIWEEWVRDANDQHPMYRFRTDENPTLDADFAASLGYEGRFAEQELGGEFVSFDGLIYDMFNRETNVKAMNTDGWRTINGVDVGARNPTVVLVIKIAGDGRVHIECEYYQRGMGSTAILNMIEQAADESNPESIFIDPSAAAYIDDLVSDGYPAEKAVNDVQTGIQRVTTAFADGLTIDPSCINAIAEFESYQYSDKGTDKDKPVKQNDHCLVAGTMVTTIDGDRAIETVSNGDLVLTRDGYREVVSAGMTNPDAEVWTVSLSNGIELTGTGGHPVYANGEWVLLNALRYGDILTETREVSSCELKPSSTVALHSGVIQTQRTWLTSDTTGHTPDTSAMAFRHFTERFGETITGISRKAGTFTTLIETRRITLSKTLSAYLRQLTSFITENCSQTNSVTDCVSKWTMRAFPHLHGMAPNLAVSGTVTMASGHGSTDSRYGRLVTSVAPSLTIYRDVTDPASARISASQHGVVHLVSTMKTEPVSHVAPHSVSTDTARHEHAPVYVDHVSAQTDRQAVYNLTVADTPEYFANGILVHNCMDAIRYGIMGGTESVMEAWIW